MTAINHDIKSSKIKKLPCDNLTKSEREAILESYVKDTTDFIKKIEATDHVSDDSYLVSLDVCSLYTNIPHMEGIEAVKKS